MVDVVGEPCVVEVGPARCPDRRGGGVASVEEGSNGLDLGQAGISLRGLFIELGCIVVMGSCRAHLSTTWPVVLRPGIFSAYRVAQLEVAQPNNQRGSMTVATRISDARDITELMS